MKTSYKLITVLLVLTFIFLTAFMPDDNYAVAEEPEESLTSADIENDEHELYLNNLCIHSTLYDFDEEAKTVKGVYEGNLIENMLNDIEFVGDTAEVICDGKTVTSGTLEPGMIVRIYHGDSLFGEYTIHDISAGFPDLSETLTEGIIHGAQAGIQSTTSSSNAYGFVLPLDGMNFTSEDISQYFSNGGHRGIDIQLANGTPIRAIASGTVVGYLAWNKSMGYQGVNSWGNYVKIDHGNGFTSLYAHMKNAPLPKLNQTVSQGEIIGYIGNTGNVSPLPQTDNSTVGSHLHLEITHNGALVDPVVYLAGAPTYNGSSHYHSFSYTYEAAHPHRQYRACSSCGHTEYTGNVRNEYVEENHEAAHPHRVYRVCACGVTEYTGATVPNYISTYYEAAHPHRVYRTCSCGAVDYTGDNHLDYISTYYEAAHPHRVYRTCSCGAVDYTGDNHLVYISTYYEGAHPHRIYRTCSCGAVDYTGGYKYVESCAQCNP